MTEPHEVGSFMTPGVHFVCGDGTAPDGSSHREVLIGCPCKRLGLRPNWAFRSRRLMFACTCSRQRVAFYTTRTRLAVSAAAYGGCGRWGFFYSCPVSVNSAD